ncbi:MAG: response regulator [Planctomycetes bacterium]|nr:response regulator [Planctomycetota bacterium]
MKLLIAEDDTFYRRMLESTLTEGGFEVIAVRDGTAAWQLLQSKEPPPIAILDWMMPGSDGLEVCRRVRALGRSEPTYLIMLTCREGKENAIAALQAGVDDYLTKPFDAAELQARLQTGVRIVELQSRLADRVRELEEALSGAQKMEAIGRLAGGVAHDFNNLLTVVLGSSDLLMERLAPGDARQEYVSLIKQAGQRGAQLTRQLLTFSRKQVLTPVVLDLNAHLTEGMQMIRRLIQEDIHVVADLAPALYEVRADPGQLLQVIMNLVVNSRDAMPKGGRLTLRTGNVDLPEINKTTKPQIPPGSYVTLAVADTGCGMDEHTRARLFEPFFTTKAMGKGTGLGLATVYGIIKQTGGYIHVETALNSGTTFTLYLPRATRSLCQPAPEAAAPLAPMGGETILLVEDEAAVRKMVSYTLQREGYRVIEACNGRDALQRTGEDRARIDLLLTDVIMPEMGGCQLAERLLTLRPAVKVLYMSGYNDDAVSQQLHLEPGTPFIQKPFEPPLLSKKVREVLAR